MDASKLRRRVTKPVQRALSSHVVVQQRLSVVWLQKVQQAGIPAVELFCARQHLDYRDKSQIRELATWFRDSELKLHSLHSPMYNDEYSGRSGPASVINITENTKSERIRMCDEIKRAIEIVELIPCKYLIQHIGVLHEPFTERKVENTFTSLEELNLFARQRGVEILLENIPNELSTAEKLNYFNGITHLNLGYVFDIGHAHIGPGVAHEFALMKERIKSLHVHDNDGKEDKHLFPTLSKGGTIDWPRTMDLLRSRPNQYPLMLELNGSAEFPDAIDAATQCFENLIILKT
jgi:sugar phosphate isomerase/epimerase